MAELWILDRGVESVLHRLADEALTIWELERRRDAAIRRRDLLMAKARRAGLSLRAIESFANVSNVAVFNGAERAERVLDPPQEPKR